MLLNKKKNCGNIDMFLSGFFDEYKVKEHSIYLKNKSNVAK